MIRGLPKAGPRKEALVSMMPSCALAAEIGADHGITSAHLLMRGTVSRMVVTDISAPSLDKAKSLFTALQLLDRAEFCVADGLEGLNEPVDAIMIAGMGGGLICRILDEGIERIAQAALVLQPNLDLPMVRRWLMENGYSIDAESLVFDAGRYYVIVRGRRGVATYTERELLLGPQLLITKADAWPGYLAWLHGKYERIRNRDVSLPLQWIKEEMRALCLPQ